VTRRARSLLREFVENNVAGGALLLAAAVIAIAWSNSPVADSYDSLWTSKLALSLGGVGLSLTLQHWINDGLMAVFFLVVGLEIKRELLFGELHSLRRAALPGAAAIGGAAVPAILFLAITGPGSSAGQGWGVPMATDIAFALGVLAMLGRRVPVGLRVFVTALAIVDDLVAVVVIAVFYTGDLSVVALAAAAVIGILLAAANRAGIRRTWVYAGLGIVLWLAVLESGLHAAIAGVLLALAVPAREPLLSWEHGLTRWVALLILPLFALANAGVALTGDIGAIVVEPVFLAIAVGLVVGKQVGITAAAWLVVRLGIGSLPAGVNWRHVYGAAVLCGIGFTMSLFIAELAFEGSSALATAKFAILAASLIAGVAGFAWLYLQPRVTSSSR
jgi:NhaA family Na+:H+ antiporter